MKRGFTLIELLAVIVILAIIALIATPIVLNIINDTKNSSQEKSVEMYINAVELSIANNMLNDLNNKPSGTYRIDDDGKKIIKIEEGKEVGNPIKVEYKGEGLTEGTIEIKEGKVTKLRGTKINGKYVAKVYDSIEFFDELPEATLIAGKTFNAQIKTLVSGQTKVDSDTDEIIKSIGFFSYGTLPYGYTKEEFLKLDQVDVSSKQDKSILALYDGNGKVFIYSDHLIFFNGNSIFMFYKLQNVETIEFGLIDTSNATTMGNMFEGCSSLISLDLSGFDTSKVSHMLKMFYGCSSLTSLDVSSFDTSKVSRMDYMFGGCKSLTFIDVSNFDTSNATALGIMFSGCSSLTTLDLSNFNTSKVTDMNGMFSGCSNLTSLDLSSFDTKNVRGFRDMFNGCKSLTSLNVRYFNTQAATTMYGMISGCSNLTSLDLSGFDIAGVTDMSYMFRWSSKLTHIEVSDKWIIGENTNTTAMFDSCGTNTVTLKQ